MDGFGITGVKQDEVHTLKKFLNWLLIYKGWEDG
jgi:hypothetical protein